MPACTLDRMTGEVVRRWRGVVRADELRAYVQYIESTGLRAYRQTAGNQGAWMLSRPLDDERAEVITVSLWDSMASVEGFAGERIEEAVFYDADDDFLLERDLEVSHHIVERSLEPDVTIRGGAESADAVQRRRVRMRAGHAVSYLVAGDPTSPALLLQHGFPNSSEMFRAMMPALAEVAYVIAPDLPGFGESDVMPNPSFDAFGETLAELLAHLGVGSRYLYLHDFGAPPALALALAEPEAVLGLIVQNANAHESGFGPAWKDTIDFWNAPSPESERSATAHLTREGTRDQYLAGVPAHVARALDHAPWEEDWRIMNLPGRMDTQRSLIADYGTYVDRFPRIADYLDEHQPPALMIWGRHDAFFDVAETLSWMRALPRMEAHVFDAGHLLVETHASQAAALIRTFIERYEADA